MDIKRSSDDGDRGTLLDRIYTDSEIATLRRTTGDNAPVLAIADFSPGPWWGANGVQTLILTTNRLDVVQRGFSIRRGRLVRSLDLSDTEILDWHVGKRMGRDAVHLSLRAGGHRRTYTSKYRQGADLAEHLSRIVKEGQ